MSGQPDTQQAEVWPLRVRLYGGRNTHAARQSTTSDDHLTACDYYLSVEAENHWQDNATPVTCRACHTAMRRTA